MRVFLPQSTLETWALEDKADLHDDRLVVPGDAHAEGYALTPAVHFVQLVSGSDDARLLARVKTASQLAGLGAEHLHDSVLVGENAYEVVPGYVADVPEPDAATPSATAQTSRTEPQPPEDLLAAFLLNKL